MKKGQNNWYKCSGLKLLGPTFLVGSGWNFQLFFFQRNSRYCITVIKRQPGMIDTGDCSKNPQKVPEILSF